MPTYTYQRPDDERYEVDANASSFVPFLTLANQKALRETRHVGASWRCARPDVAFSTHPRAWWGMAFVVPLYPGATTLNVTVAVSCTDVNGSARIAIEGRVSAAQTVTAGGTVQFLTFLVPTPNVQAPRDAYATIQFRSGIGSTTGTLTVHGSNGPNRVTISGSGGSAVPAATHVALRAEDSARPEGEDTQWHEGYYYAGSFTGSTNHSYRVWPSVSVDDSLTNNGKFASFPLTQFNLRSHAFWLSGVDTSDLVPEDNVRPGVPVYSADLVALHREHLEMYSARRPVALRDYRLGNQGCVAGALTWAVMAEALGVSGDAVCLTLPGYGELDTRAATVDFAMDTSSATVDDFPTDPDNVTAADSRGTAQAGAAEYWSRDSLEDGGTLVAFGLRYILSATAWGARDLMHLDPGPSDLDRMVPVRIANAGYYAWLGDDNRPYQTTGVYVTAAQVRSVRALDYVTIPSSTAVLPGELIRGKTTPYEGPAVLKSGGEDVQTDCLRVLYSSLAPSLGVTFDGSSTTWIDYLVIHTSPAFGGQVLASAAGYNVSVRFDVYDTSGTPVDDVPVTMPNTLSFSIAVEGTLQLANDTTYYVKVTATWYEEPSGLAPIREAPRLQAIRLRERLS